MWFTNYDYPTGGNSIGRITTSGSVTTYSGSGIDGALYIAAGPDGALWFSDDHRIDHKGHAIGRITTDGKVTTYTGDGIGEPFDITAGPDGAMWFDNFKTIEGPANIGRITTDGRITTYPIDGATFVYSMTAGPDGALWFTGFDETAPGLVGYGVVGRIATSGDVTLYPDGSTDIPSAITAGSDGALVVHRRISTRSAGSRRAVPVTDYPIPPRKFFELEDITAGPDGALWFTGSKDYIGRITTAGVVSIYPGVPEPSPGELKGTFDEPVITAGPDGALLFTTAPGANSLGRISAPSASG